MEDQPQPARPYRQGEAPPARDTSDTRRWVVSKDADPAIRMAYEPAAAQAFVAHNPGWSAIAEDDPRWLPYRPGLD